MRWEGGGGVEGGGSKGGGEASCGWFLRPSIRLVSSPTLYLFSLFSLPPTIPFSSGLFSLLLFDGLFFFLVLSQPFILLLLIFLPVLFWG